MDSEEKNQESIEEKADTEPFKEEQSIENKLEQAHLVINGSDNNNPEVENHALRSENAEEQKEEPGKETGNKNPEENEEEKKADEEPEQKVIAFKEELRPCLKELTRGCISVSDYFEAIKGILLDYKYDQAAEILNRRILVHPDYSFEKLSPNDQLTVGEVQKVMREIEDVFKELNDEEGWWLERGGGNSVVKYKQIPGTRNYTIKMEAELDFSLFNMCALVYEIDLFTEWIPFCSKAQQMKRIGMACKVATFTLNLPFLANRVAYLKGMGIDRLQENGSVLIISHTIDSDHEFLKREKIEIPQDNKVVLLDLDRFCFEVTPINLKKFKLRTLANVNPKLDIIPQWIINYCIRKVGSYLFDKMIKVAKNMKNSKWEANMKKEENRDFYEWIAKKIEHYYGTEATSE